MVKGMYIQDYGKSGNYYGTAQGYRKENGGIQETPFSGYIDKAEGNNKSRSFGKGIEEDGKNREECTEQEEWEEKLRKWDEEMERARERNRRECERQQAERIRIKRIRRKLLEKLAYKKYLARQDEIMQMNEKISLERAVGEDVYIEKAPLSKSLSVAEIMAICSKY